MKRSFAWRPIYDKNEEDSRALTQSFAETRYISACYASHLIHIHSVTMAIVAQITLEDGILSIQVLNLLSDQR